MPPSRLFDAYIVVDWSASASASIGVDSIWIGHSEWIDGRLIDRDPVNRPTRSAAIEDVASRLEECLKHDRRVLVGFDFPYGYPRGLGASLRSEERTSDPDWLLTWKRLRSLINDGENNQNNRFEVAARLNTEISVMGGPFWGRPRNSAASSVLPATMPGFPFKGRARVLRRYRLAEQRLRQRGGNIQETWKLYGAGSVGSQTLLGVPRVLALRQRKALASKSAVWPFETGFTDRPTLNHSIVHAEIWPSVIACTPAKGQVKDAAQVYGLAHYFGLEDGEGSLAAWFRRPVGLSDDEVADCVSEEGWILNPNPARPVLDADSRRHLRDGLRDARARALEDAEGFQPVVVAIERLGAALTGEVHSLKAYEAEVIRFVDSHLGQPVASMGTPFGVLYDLVRRGRNDAAHQGAFARHLTRNAVEVALVLEEALMADSVAVRDFMVRTPISAEPWYSVATVRQLMLVHSFSCLPIFLAEGEQVGWRLLSDVAVAQYLRADGTDRPKRLAALVGEAIRSGKLKTELAPTCEPGEPISRVLAAGDKRVSLVLEAGSADRLCGVITPFDLL